MALHKTVAQEPIGELHPDPHNPRFPENQRDWDDDDGLFVFIADTFDAVSVAESIAEHAYFPSEPLVVTQEGKRNIVLEGNRRLAALHGLARPSLRIRFAEVQRWEAAAQERKIDLDLKAQ